MSQDLNQDELNELADLLLLSQKSKAREALCIKIGISYYKELGFIYESSDSSFAINLISHLNDVGNTKAICQLCCKELSPIFQGYRKSFLKEIAVKLKCNHEFDSLSSSNNQEKEFEHIRSNEKSPSTSGVKLLFEKLVTGKNKLITGGAILLIVLAGYPTYEYLKQPPQLVEDQALRQKAPLVQSEIEGNIGAHRKGGTLVKPITKVDLRNFIVESQFDNPYDGTIMDYWAYGFSFRENTSNDLNDPNRKGFTISVRSKEKEWNFTSPSISLNGKLSNLYLKDKGSNKLSLTVKDKKARFFVNDMYIETFDISEITNKGDVFLIAAGGISGKSVQYQYKNLRVWSLDN